jgi:mRNA deadenylase 3'-5' endonuclease subunit Ccr4
MDDIPSHSFIKVLQGEPSHGPSIRVACYNVLADCYKKRDDAPFAQRGKRVLKELLSVCPDIICVQEIEQEGFSFLASQLQRAGFFESCFVRNAQPDGVAMFVRQSVKLIQWHKLEFGSVADHPDIIRGLKHHSVVVSAHVSWNGSDILVSTAHLYWGHAEPTKNYEIQRAQAQVWLAHCQTIPCHSRILCGDMNQATRGESDLVKFICSCGFHSVYEENCPATVFHARAQKCIDYIFYAGALACTRRLALQTPTSYCPNSMYPSDHLLICGDFEILTR